MADSLLTVRFEALGRETTRIKSWSIDSDYLVSTDGFEFELLDDPDNVRALECQPVELLVNGASQLLGRIDVTERGDDGAAVTCRGRDYIADLVECNVDPSFTIKTGELLGEVVVRACSPVGITNISDASDVAAIRNVRTGVTLNNLGGFKSFSEIQLNDFKPQPGQGIYEFLKPIVDRHGCTIQPGMHRYEVMLAAPYYSQDVAYTLRRTRNGAANNVISARATRDFSSFPSMVIVKGPGSTEAGESDPGATAVIDTWSEAQHFGGELARTLNTITWSGRRKPGDRAPLGIDKIYRLNMFRDEKARNAAQINKAARKLLAEHLKNTLVYSATVRGHVDPETNAVWSVDTIVTVNDDLCDVHEPLWIMKRTLKFSPTSGATTDIVAVRPGSFEPDGEATSLSIAQFNAINGIGQ